MSLSFLLQWAAPQSTDSARPMRQRPPLSVLPSGTWDPLGSAPSSTLHGSLPPSTVAWWEAEVLLWLGFHSNVGDRELNAKTPSPTEQSWLASRHPDLTE